MIVCLSSTRLLYTVPLLYTNFITNTIICQHQIPYFSNKFLCGANSPKYSFSAFSLATTHSLKLYEDKISLCLLFIVIYALHFTPFYIIFLLYPIIPRYTQIVNKNFVQNFTHNFVHFAYCISIDLCYNYNVRWRSGV